ncbi:MAG: hypothetical protein AUF67_06370 [Acidobacteria bacterium 13_1_20CM_58_21]|nr:MAG: hypothetical protein AUF67_06370 [Acidobacteria bacterium 13_1_20CM_58_21]
MWKTRREQRADQVEQLVESRLFVQRDVVDLVDGSRVIDHGREQIRLDCVVDIGLRRVSSRFEPMNPAMPVTSQVRGLIVRRSCTASYVVIPVLSDMRP